MRNCECTAGWKMRTVDEYGRGCLSPRYWFYEWKSGPCTVCLRACACVAERGIQLRNDAAADEGNGGPRLDVSKLRQQTIPTYKWN